MSFVQSFTAAPTSDPSQIVLTDTSTGSDSAITDRKIQLLQSSGVLLVPQIDWPLGQSPITISPLQADVALNIVVNWINSSGTPLYTFNLLYEATQYAEQFYLSLTQQQSATTNPNILVDSQYYNNKSWLRTLIDSAVQAIQQGSDLYSSQFCIQLYQPMLNNPNLYF